MTQYFVRHQLIMRSKCLFIKLAMRRDCQSIYGKGGKCFISICSQEIDNLNCFLHLIISIMEVACDFTEGKNDQMCSFGKHTINKLK